MMKQIMSLDEIKAIEVGILDYIDRVCRKHNLTYFLAYGTLIGAVRHKGFIPWDDDIDIAMPRDDYNKLLELLSKEEANEQFECLIPMKNDYFYEFAKVVDTTTCVHEVHTISSHSGVWVDIFPFDGLDKDDKITHYMLLLLNRCRAASVNQSFPHKTSGIWVPMEYIFWRICKLITYRPFLKWSIKLSQKHKYEDCEFVGYASSYPAHNKYMRRVWFENTIDLDFENKKFKAPSKYHEYLSTQYGDYMKLPPENQRICHQMEAYRLY